MCRFHPFASLDANVRGALTLGALLAFVFVIAFFGAFGIYRQLDAAVEVERTLVKAEHQLSDVLRAQLDEEAGLRGFLATKQRNFLDPFLSQADVFDKQVDQLQFAVGALDINKSDLAPLLIEMKLLHASWEEGVARPLLDAPQAPHSVELETLGKVLIDRLRFDITHVDQLLNARLLRAQNDLRGRIDYMVGEVLAAILLFGSIGIIYVGSRTRMLARIGRERSIIETLQGAFRTGWDALPGSRVGTAYVSATADADVGGDLYDVCKLDDTRGLLLVADVSGKGIEAAVNTAFIKYSIRMAARAYGDPARILSEFNNVFMATIKEPNLFVSAFVGIVDVHAMTLCYAGAGHATNYLRRDGVVRQLPATGPIIGIGRDVTFGEKTMKLKRADMLVLATDGLTEARDARGKQIQDDAISLVRNASTDPQRCADELVAAVRSHSGGTLRDDLALLVLSLDGRC
jgi:hypothetical protein